MPGPRTVYRYALERLYVDQPAEFVSDTIPAVLAWVPGATKALPRQMSHDGRAGDSKPRLLRRSPHDVAAAGPTFELEIAMSKRRTATLTLGWDLAALTRRDPRVEVRARTMHPEHVPELAAYGLALVAISVLLPGRRMVAWSRWSAPDILFDETPGALRGVEVAGRSQGGWAALRVVCDGSKGSPGKRRVLRDSPDVAEAYLSLWCSRPRVSMMVQVKP